MIESPAGSYGWRPVLIMAALFFSIGFVTWLNGPLITFVQVAFSLDDVTAFLVPMCFYLAYFFFPLPATMLSRKIGLRKGLIVALFVMAAGTALFGECVTARFYAGALGGLTVIGAGLSLLQITVNPYVSLLGDHDRAAQRIAIMGTANKFAGILAPMLFAVLVMPHVSEVAASLRSIPAGPERDTILANFAHAVHAPYAAMAGVLVLLAILVARSSLPEISLDAATPTTSGSRAHPLWLVTGVLSMFLYVGVEVLAGDAIGLYGRSFGLSLDVTKYLTALTLAAMMAGYLVGMVVVPRFVTQRRYTVFCCVLGIAFCLLALVAAATSGSGMAPVLCVALLGFANAMILPALFPVVLAEAGADPGTATAFLVMAYSGGAVIPQIFVHLAPRIGVAEAFMALAIPCYVVIAVWMLAFMARTAETSSPAGLKLTEG
ncbi:glucose/galactose transporter [Acetobacter nitrogenifigens DSM 23921 = NBRC 105050]|uniref:Glucose/galactose MFS transporter n=1 Tax=Acetobacter nitrogenifigens DSM 23921 = NBRC 105050 TaxID=1120919 RepID=A0A511XBX1_9PROT|nr:glucose/galactose MFS transporter [Acetobacter nitrogenifigens]GBQ88380.1 glucose/galactose transporter [Acetobacter nitrogenifigens DSM 23921 = NBRC 105050]GEN60385.1 glucose/galactose MFS transporter [Acetobacter nitrogenifigens DSM 23921 = NBRC 105050]